MSIYGKQYPWLRLRDLYSGEIDTESDAMDDMPEGWRKAFGSMMCEELDAAIKAAGLEDEFIFEQVKEKYGELRIYCSPYNREVDEIIRKYEVLSSNICIHCGKPDVPMLITNWIRPSCRECYINSNRITGTYEMLSKGHADRMSDSYKVTRRKWIAAEKRHTDPVETVYDIHETADKIRSEYARRIKKPDFTEHTGEPEWN